MQPLSAAIPRVSSKLFERKYIRLGRLVTGWTDIVGERIAARTQPIKLNFRKPAKKGDIAKVTLTLAVTSADATAMQYRTGMMLERIRAVLGDNFVHEIKFVHRDTRDTPAAASGPGKNRKKRPLSEADKGLLQTSLADVADPAIKERLEKFGAALLSDTPRA